MISSRKFSAPAVSHVAGGKHTAQHEPCSSNFHPDRGRHWSQRAARPQIRSGRHALCGRSRNRWHHLTIGQCVQVLPPIGPYKGGNTGRISRIDKKGNRTTVASGFPSSVAAEGDLQGVADIAWVDGQLLALLAGGGCSHGNAGSPNGIALVNTHTGSWKLEADLSHFVQTHPAKYPDAADFEPDGVFYSMVAYQNRLYTVEPNHGQVFSVGGPNDIYTALESPPPRVTSSRQRSPNGTATSSWAISTYFPSRPTFSRMLELSRVACNPALELIDGGGPRSLHIVASKAGLPQWWEPNLAQMDCSMYWSYRMPQGFPPRATAKSCA